jgi:integrase
MRLFVESVVRLRGLFQLPETPMAAASRIASNLLQGKFHTAQEPLCAYAFLADMADVNRGTQGLLKVVDGLKDIIIASFEVVEAEYRIEQQWLCLIEEFRQDIVAHLQESAFQLEPVKKQNILAYFLYHTRKLIFDLDQERWRRLCLAAYRATRVAVNSVALSDEVEWNRAQRQARSIEVILRYLPADSWRREGSPLTLSPEAIVDAISASQSLRRPEFQRETAEGHGRLATPLFSGKPYSWNEANRTRISAEAARETRNLDATPTQKLQDEPGADPSSELRKEQVDEGAAPSEFDPLTNLPTQRLAPVGSANRAYATRPAGKLPLWARSLLTAEALGFTLAWLLRGREVEQMPASDLQTLTFILLQVSYGFKPEVILKAKRGKQPGDSEAQTLQLVYDHGTFWVTPLGQDGNLVFAVGSEKPSLYMPSSHSVPLPAPRIIQRCLARLEHFYSRAAEQNTWLFPSHNDATAKGELALVEAINDQLRPLLSTLRERVEVDRISRSATILLTEGGRTDELILGIIQANIPRHLRSQAHYTSLAYNTVQETHTLTYKNLLKHLCEASRPLIESFKLPPIDHLFSDDLAPQSSSAALPDLNRRMGSPFVPKTELMRTYIERLRTAIGHNDEWRVRFNRFVAYVVLAVMHLTGIRPDEVKRLSTARISLSDEEGSLAVDGKVNGVHREWRVIDLAPLAVQQLLVYQAHAADAIQRIWRDHARTLEEIQQARQQALFFFISRRYLPVPITTRTLGNYLRTADELGMPPFDWRLNSPRHFYRTKAVELGVPSTIIDALLGHSSRGREPLGIFSQHDRLEEREAAIFIASKVTEDLGLVLIEPERQKPF